MREAREEVAEHAGVLECHRGALCAERLWRRRLWRKRRAWEVKHGIKMKVGDNQWRFYVYDTIQ